MHVLENISRLLLYDSIERCEKVTVTLLLLNNVDLNLFEARTVTSVYLFFTIYHIYSL